MIIILLVIIILSLGLTSYFRQNQYRKDLDKSLNLAGNWFTKNQTDRGDFVYQRRVTDGEESDRNDIVRQAYALYSLSLFNRYSQDGRVDGAVKKGILFFKQYAKEGTFTAGEKTYKTYKLVYRDNQINSYSALVLLALINYLEKYPDKKNELGPFAEGLAHHLLSTQKPSGGFVYKTDPDEENDINDGEVFYALARYSSYSKNPLFLEATKKSAEYFVGKYDSNNLNMSFFGWGLQGYFYLYKESPDEKYWRYIRDNSSSYLRSSGAEHLRFYSLNGNIAPPASLPATLEGLNHAGLIAQSKDPEFFKQLKSYIDSSVFYLQQFQINGPLSERKSAYEKLTGGTCLDYYCELERIDATGHYVSALYFYLKFFK